MSNFAVTSSPHLRDKATSQRIMQEVCLALAPAGIAGIILYGFNAAILIAICVATCVLSEFLWQKATQQQVTISDWSAVVTGLLLAYNLPSTAPWWIAVVGSVIAIILVKQMFGGIGSNFMNPALTARAVLFLSWSTIMASYPTSNLPDAVTGATPLNALKNVIDGKAEMAGLKFDLVDLLLVTTAACLARPARSRSFWAVCICLSAALRTGAFRSASLRPCLFATCSRAVPRWRCTRSFPAVCCWVPSSWRPTTLRAPSRVRAA